MEEKNLSEAGKEQQPAPEADPPADVVGEEIGTSPDSDIPEDQTGDQETDDSNNSEQKEDVDTEEDEDSTGPVDVEAEAHRAPEAPEDPAPEEAESLPEQSPVLSEADAVETSTESSDLLNGSPNAEELSDEGVQTVASIDEARAHVTTPGSGLPPRQLQVPDSAITRFRRWLRGSTAIGKTVQEHSTSVEGSEIQDDPAEGLKEDEQAFSAEKAAEEMASLQESHGEWSDYVAAQEQIALEIKEQIAKRESQLSSLNDWVAQYDRSYQWQVQKRMDQQLATAQADLRAYENSAQNVEEFEEGRLVELRKRFHKLIAGPSLIGLLLAALVVVLPILFRIPKLDALETFYDPRLSAPIIFLVVGAVITLVLLVRRALGKDRIQNLTIVRWILLAFFVGLSVLAMPTLEGPIRDNVIPFIETYLWLILAMIAAVVLAWILIALTIYYQGWSQYRRGVENQLARLRAVISGYVETRQEVNRLTLLYEQTADWLEILAHALYRPWAVDPAWEEKRRVDSDFEDFPFSLRVAQVDDEEGAKSAELERLISTRLLVQGWRAQAFDDLIHQIALDLGVGVSKFNVESLDRDLPHQTNNTRNVLRGYLEVSAGQENESAEDHSARNPHLVEVARQRLKVLIQETQSAALSAARPSVTQMIRDPLESIDFDGEGTAADKRSEDWDSFLKESLGTDEIIKPPLSVLGLSSKGKMNKVGEHPSTFTLIPERLRQALPREAGEVSEIVAVSDDTARPVEIIARIDVSRPLQQGDLRLLEAESHREVSDQRQKTDSKTRAAPICQECHDPTCPASADSSARCVNTGA